MDLHRKFLILLFLAATFAGQTGSINVDENHNGHKIFGLPTPTAGTKPRPNKAYADSIGWRWWECKHYCHGAGDRSASPLTGTGVISLSGTTSAKGF